MDESPVISEFESAWQQRRYADIDGMLAASNRSIDAAAELVMIDMEYRWRYPLPADQRGKATIPNCPRVEDYFRVVPALIDCSQLLLELIGEEYRVRLRWGDAPVVGELTGRFGAYRDSIEPMIQKIQRDVPHLCVTIVRGGSEVIQALIHRDLEIGRQSVDQPPPFCEVQWKHTSKLIVAALDNVQVSRNQLHLTRCDTGVRLKNLSSQVALKVGSVSLLKPSQIAEYRLPVTVSIGDLEVRVALRGN